ncbi:MAG: TrkA C-terminal domain-containing protein [Acidimicrobiia bacterium]
MDDKPPRNLKAMLSEAKDTSELMVDLAYAALFYGDAGMAGEVEELEERLEDLAHAMREVCVLAARSPRDAEEMSSVLHVLAAIERMGNAAVDIARIVTHRLGIPAALVADLAAAEEVSHRVRVRGESALANRKLADVELPIEVGMRVVAIRRGKDWVIDPDGDDMMLPEDVLILRGAAGGIAELRVLAGAPEWRPPGTDDDPAVITDLDRAVDVLVEMKNVSEVAIGLAYSALLFNDQSLAAEVNSLEDRLDEMRERLEVWVLRAASEQIEPSPLRGLLHLGGAAEELGDAAQQMVWLVEEGEEMHPVLAMALGESDEVIVRVPISPGSFLDGRTLAEAELELETGYYLLAIRRAGRYLYRPRKTVRLEAGDELIASGPDEGRERLAELGGYRVLEDDATGEIALIRVDERLSH